jgi:osmotically-inducible protein OsmY
MQITVPSNCLTLGPALAVAQRITGGVMADRYGHRDEPYRGERDWRDERGFTDRTRDEVRSWFGDEEAARRRRMDEREREWREPPFGSSERDRSGRSYVGERGWRGEAPERWSTDYGRAEFDRSQAPYRSWNEPPSGSGSTMYGYGRDWTGRSTAWSGSPYATGGAYGEPNRWRPGDTFIGRGPKGYQRSDERIREEVCDRLADDPWVDAGDIEVTVKNGEVTLSGAVREREDKRRSEDLTDNVSGVREVHNNLRVNTGQNVSGSPSAGATVTGSARR